MAVSVSDPAAAFRPLGVRDEVELTPAVARQLQRLVDFDLGRVERRLRDHGLLPNSWIAEAVLEFRRFIGLRVLTGQRLPMISPYVDEVWHQSILFTRMYFDLGEQVCGGYLHHEPLDGDDADQSEDGQPAVDEFVAAYERTYGPLPDFWTLHLR